MVKKPKIPNEVQILREEELLSLSGQLASAKEDEEIAKATRISIEEEIAKLVPSPESGQKTVKLKDGSKLTVKRGLIYKADVEDIRNVFSDEAISEKMYPPIKTTTKEELDEKGYEWYRLNYPQIFLELSEFVTVTPKKISVTIQGSKS
jgi:methionine aminopeptidase